MRMHYTANPNSGLQATTACSPQGATVPASMTTLAGARKLFMATNQARLVTCRTCQLKARIGKAEKK